MNILVTAIGSMSADCVINSLKKLKHKIIGCDIYPAEWHATSKDCDKVYKSPLTSNEASYVQFLIDISNTNNINYIFPLTDLEVDVINKFRNDFENKGIIVCLPNAETLSIARNKLNLYNRFKDDPKVPSILTFNQKSDNVVLPSSRYIAKPCNGRSSEGVIHLSTKSELDNVLKLENYIIQEYKSGSIYTVDYIRNGQSGRDFSIQREELLRTKNGAGLTVRVKNNKELSELASYIGNELNVNGCINMEFIYNNEKFYLIDINPRFSAGIAFSIVSGYNMVKSHLNCFIGQDILDPVPIDDLILTKRYKEEIL